MSDKCKCEFDGEYDIGGYHCIHCGLEENSSEHKLRQEIEELEAKLKAKYDLLSQLGKKVEGLEKKLELEKHKTKSWKVEHDSIYERLVENEKSTSKKYKLLLDMYKELEEESER